MDDDILDSVLDLEEISYQAGFDEGRADGIEAGYAEGKVLGIEKGYQNALELGKLHGRTLMLNACFSDPNLVSDDATVSSFIKPATAKTSASTTDNDAFVPKMPSLPIISDNPRLKKHVETLLKLTDPHTLSVENSDEAVEEFDDRMKKAVAKAKVIDKLIAKTYKMTVSGDAGEINNQPITGSGNIEELSNVAVRH